MYRRISDPTPENIRVSLPEELAEACSTARLKVLWTPFGHDQALLQDLRTSTGVRPYLFVEELWPMERVEWTVRQSLADLGAPGFEGVAVEPFGQLPTMGEAARV